MNETNGDKMEMNPSVTEITEKMTESAEGDLGETPAVITSVARSAAEPTNFCP